MKCSFFEHKKSFISLLFLVVAIGVMAQKDFLLYQTDDIFQRHALNPAFTSQEGKFHLGIPVLSNINVGVSNGAFTLSQFIQTRSDDSLILNYENALDQLRDFNKIDFDFQTDWLSLGFHHKDNFFSFSVSEHIKSRWTIPRDLPQFLWEGNGQQFLGNRASFDGLSIDFMAYREFAFGFSRKIDKALTVGTRFKFLQGHANLHTNRLNFGIHTDEKTYDLTIDGSGRVMSSGVFPFLDNEIGVNDLLFNNNFGFAMDFGVNYEYKKWNFSASLLDFGVIRWKNFNQVYDLFPFEIEYQGVPLESFLEDAETSFQQLVDSLEGVFTPAENNRAYTIPLYARVFMGANYTFSEKLNFSFLYNAEFINRNHNRQGLSVATHYKMLKWLSTSMSYTIYNRSFTNIGLGFTLHGGPVQFYFMTDNTLGLIIPDRIRNWHGRVGLNFRI